MATKSEQELSEIVARVVAEVTQEVKDSEASFGVADLRNSVASLAKAGGPTAWSISYSTARSSIEKLRDVVKVGGPSAWSISYSTARSLIETKR